MFWRKLQSFETADLIFSPDDVFVMSSTCSVGQDEVETDEKYSKSIRLFMWTLIKIECKYLSCGDIECSLHFD